MLEAFRNELIRLFYPTIDKMTAVQIRYEVSMLILVWLLIFSVYAAILYYVCHPKPPIDLDAPTVTGVPVQYVARKQMGCDTKYIVKCI